MIRFIFKLRRLIESGRAMTTGDNRGWRPIHFAADLGRKDCLDLLVDKGEILAQYCSTVIYVTVRF